MSRAKNQYTDALATLASMINIPVGSDQWAVVVKLQEEPAYCQQIEPESDNGLPWYADIKSYLENLGFPKDAITTDRRTLQRLVAQYVINGGVLYKLSFNHVLLRCVDEKDAEKIMF